MAEIGNHFLVGNYALINITLPRAKVIGKFFCANNENLEKIDLPSVEKIGVWFLGSNKGLKKFTCLKPNILIVLFYLEIEDWKRLYYQM